MKKQRVRKRIYKAREMARADVFDYIEVFYNRSRRHSRLGGIGPEGLELAAARGRSLSSRPAEVQFPHVKKKLSLTWACCRASFPKNR